MLHTICSTATERDLIGHGPLAGVYELSFIAGPFAGQLLGDYGADVIKVELPVRAMPCGPGAHTGTGKYCGGRRSPATSSPSPSTSPSRRPGPGPPPRVQLDVVLENFRAGRFQEWGLDYTGSGASIRASSSCTYQDSARRANVVRGRLRVTWGKQSAGSGPRPARQTARHPAPASASATPWLPVRRDRHPRSRSTSAVERPGQEIDVAIYEAVSRSWSRPWPTSRSPGHQEPHRRILPGWRQPTLTRRPTAAGGHRRQR